MENLKLIQMLITFITLVEDENITNISDMNVVENYRYKIQKSLNEKYDLKMKKVLEIEENGIPNEKLPF